MNKTCPICGDGVPAGFGTCGRSRCQEANYLANKARAMKPGKRKAAAEKEAAAVARDADARSRRERGVSS